MLADEPGVGKTNQLLLAAQGRTLVLSPAALSDVWDEEIELWHPDAEITWGSYSSVCKRVPTGEVSKTGNPIYNVVAAPREDLARRWDTIICDEAHYLKARGTVWTKVVSTKLKSDRIYLATGTPLPNWAHEIFMFLRLIHPGDKRFTNYWNWVYEYFRTWKPPWGGTKITGLQRGFTWEQAAQEWGLADRWLRRTFDEVLPDLPPMTSQTIELDMVPKQMSVYRRLEEDWFAVLQETGTEVVSWNDGGKYQKLLQCSTGLSTLDLDETGSCKLDVVRELMAERTHPTIMFCAYKNTAEALGRLLVSMKRSVGVVSSAYSMNDRQATIRGFKEGKYDVLVGTVGTLSEGVTLTRADCCIFVERSPRPFVNSQARRRVRRFGQDRPTLAIDLVTKNTVDAELVELLKAKIEDTDLAITGFQLAARRGFKP